MKYLASALLILTPAVCSFAQSQPAASAALPDIHFNAPSSSSTATSSSTDAIALPPVQTQAQQPANLQGKISDGVYFSPTGAYYLKVPVLTELGGRLTDTARVVTFRDDYTTHISIATFKLDATQSWQLSVKGTKDYLQYFFHDFVLPDFASIYRGLKIEPNGRYLPTLNDGSLVTFITIPGGSMFASTTPRLAEPTQPPVAKRGNMLFLKNGYIYVVSMELAERITEGSAYKKTSEEEDVLLRDRLVNLVKTFHFIKQQTNN
jgi:hypothetical protein